MADYTEEDYRRVLSRPAPGCVDGSFEHAYHCLQNAPSLMNDDMLMFEAGKQAERMQHQRRLHKAAQAAVKEAVDKVFTEQNNDE